MSQYDATGFATNNFCRATYVQGRTTKSLFRATKIFSHTIKQLLHQCHKILALCNITGELASSFSLNIAHSQYFVILMQELINILSSVNIFTFLAFFWTNVSKDMDALSSTTVNDQMSDRGAV